MSNTYKTAAGKNLDMAVLRAKNENVRAVGNMRVNAKGDIVDGKNQVIKPVGRRVTDQFNRTIVNPGAQATPAPQPTAPPRTAINADELNEFERALTQDDFMPKKP